MDKVITVAIGFAGCGTLAAIAYFISSHFANKSNILEAVHKVTQKIGINKVKEIEKKEEVLAKKIKVYEDLSEDSKKKIKVIKKKANVEINEILLKENFEELSKEEDELW